MVLKRIVSKCSGSTAAAAWGQMTAGKAEAGLVSADVLTVRWWLKERQLVDACHLVKTVVVCQSAGSSSLTVDS